jgi:hypothetical protein
MQSGPAIPMTAPQAAPQTLTPGVMPVASPAPAIVQPVRRRGGFLRYFFVIMAIFLLVAAVAVGYLWYRSTH